MKIGVVNKVFLEFDSCFYEENFDSFCFASDHNQYAFFFNMKPYYGRNVLMG